MKKYKCHSLIIGGSGQFGITLKNQLNKKNKKVIITSRFKKSTIKKKKFEIVVLDIFNKEKIFKLIKKYEPQNIFYFAGQSSPSVLILSLTDLSCCIYPLDYILTKYFDPRP